MRSALLTMLPLLVCSSSVSQTQGTAAYKVYPGHVHAIAFGTDGTTGAAAGCTSKTIHLFDLKGGKEVRTLDAPSKGIEALSFGPDGRALAARCRLNRVVWLWNLESGRLVHTFGETERVRCFAFSPNGKKLATGAGEKVILWDTATGKQEAVLGEHPSSVDAVAFSADGTLLASGCVFESEELRPRAVIKIRDLAAGKDHLTLKHTHCEGISYLHALAFSADGKVLASGTNPTVKLWDTTTGAELATLPQSAQALEFARDGKRLASMHSGDEFSLWEVPTGRLLASVQAHDSDEQWCAAVAFDPDRKTLLTGGPDSKVKLWELAKLASDEPQARQLDAEKIGTAAGVKATTAPDGVVRIAWPRTDVAVTVDGMPLKPFAGLGSGAAFTPTPHGAMVMGDTVVFQDEVDAAMDAAFAHHLEVTALHNHFFYDEPKVYFMHIGGMGEPEKLAAGVKAVWDAIKKVRADNPKPATKFAGDAPKAGTVMAEPIEKVLGHKSESQAGVVKVTIGREGTMHGVKVAGSMGLTTWATFSVSDELAAVDGDFIMTAAEIQSVLRALRKANIHIVALHNHMAGEQPASYFTHFWGKGKAEELAKSLKSALDDQAKAGKKKGH